MSFNIREGSREEKQHPCTIVEGVVSFLIEKILGRIDRVILIANQIQMRVEESPGDCQSEQMSERFETFFLVLRYKMI
jgi:hypothetical protein